MTYKYNIICLANSRKLSGRCIAGKILLDNNQIGGWLRPVGVTSTHEITEYDREYENGSTAQTLDVIEITFTQQQRHSFQFENHIIDDNVYWKKIGQWSNSDLDQLVDSPASLWTNESSSGYGTNDRVHQSNLSSCQTLYLIRPEKVCISVGPEYTLSKKEVRATFTYNGIDYALKVTDPDVEKYYKGLENGNYDCDTVQYFTISLGEIFNEYAYKLIAKVF